MSDLVTRERMSSENDSVYCKVCQMPFDTLQNCLAHELLRHTIRPQKKLRKCLDAITKLLASEQIQRERRLLKASLTQAAAGQHLRAILATYAGDCNKMLACHSQVQEILQRQLQGKVKVYPYGSLVTGLVLKDSDIDLYLEQPEVSDLSHRSFFNRIYNCLRRSVVFQDVFAIRHARVPIIRCKHVYTGLSLDINMSSPNSMYNSRFVSELLGRDVRMRELFMFLKLWAKMLKIIGSGSMTSYCLITLIIFGMQQRQLLPSIKQLQARCQVHEVMGVNYAYSLQQVRPIPASVTTQELISDFFELYSKMDFERKLISPYLGYALDLETAFTVPGQFPEYEQQLRAMEEATGKQPEPFQDDRFVCVQDPFEMQHNVAQSISKTNLCYFRECLALAHQACSDKKLTSTPAELYDYLLFGLPEQLLQSERMVEYGKPFKIRKLMQTRREQALAAEAAARTAQLAQPTEPPPPPPAVGASAAAVEDAVAPETPAPAASPAQAMDIDAVPSTAALPPETPMEVAEPCTEKLPATSTVENSPPIMHVHILKPTKNDVKILRPEVQNQNGYVKKTIFYYWAECYVKAIRHILANIYALNVKSIEPEENGEVSQQNGLPQQLTWLISSSLDTWSTRNFQRCTNPNDSFLAQQMQQTTEFVKTRPTQSAYVVNLSGRFSLVLGADYKELRLELQPMPNDVLGLQRHSPLTKFFKSLKNMLSNYTFKEKFNLQALQSTR